MPSLALLVSLSTLLLHAYVSLAENQPCVNPSPVFKEAILTHILSGSNHCRYQHGRPDADRQQRSHDNRWNDHVQLPGCCSAHKIWKS